MLAHKCRREQQIMLLFDDSDDEGTAPMSPSFPFLEVKTAENHVEQPDLQTEIVSNISKGGLTLKSNE